MAFVIALALLHFAYIGLQMLVLQLRPPAEFMEELFYTATDQFSDLASYHILIWLYNFLKHKN